MKKKDRPGEGLLKFEEEKQQRKTRGEKRKFSKRPESEKRNFVPAGPGERKKCQKKRKKEKVH